MSYSDNQLANATRVTTASASDSMWLNIGGSIRQILLSNFATVFGTLVAATAKRQNVRTIAANSSATTSDDIIQASTSGGDVTVNLLTAAQMHDSETGSSLVQTFRQTNHSSNSLFLLPPSGTTLNGSSSAHEIVNNAAVAIYSDGSALYTINA